MTTKPTQVEKLVHPLEPLTAEEISKAVAILSKEQNLAPSVRFAQVVLHEPAKEVVLNFSEHEAPDRLASLIILKPETNETFEALVSLTTESVAKWEFVPDAKPGFILDEFDMVEELVKQDPDYQAALLKRGVADPSLVMVDPWSAGYYNIEEDEGKRLVRALAWVRPAANENGYAYPITGLIAVVDVNKMEIVRIEDYGVKPLPPTDGAYVPEEAKSHPVEVRTDLKPLDIIQPEGPSFTFDGHSIDWQKWKIRFGFTPREGLVLHTVGYEDKGAVRPILYRAALSEMVVPYSDVNPAHNWQNAFDAGEYGIGQLANSLELGCDCVGHIQYFDAVMANSKGEPFTIKNAVCLHEEDYGIAWKHTDWRTNQVDVRRSRRLVLSFFATVANYDYGFFWSFYPDGTIECEVKLTGILNVGALDEGEKPKYGTEVAPQVNAPYHQHFFNFRIDPMIDGVNNSLVESHTVAEKAGPENPNGNAFYTVAKTFKTESESVSNIDLVTQKTWRIVNPESKNHVGQPVSYKIVTGENCFPFAADSATVIQRAGFIKNHLHVTKFDPDQMYASGKYPNQSKGGDSLEHYVKADRPIENEDIVVWYTMGHHHITRTEDWPVMPTAYQSFQLKPVGFFDRNPALDLPRPTPKAKSCGMKQPDSCH
ncbi:primary-amine oxidase [Planomicrobium sp. CPCC 101110]|uniref:primary-amine oxidase n=1 Tax=Planomicrobium sp. CPCC 101110 TaxID=2599619 RepID=UPI0011B64A5B|nr:primary-amine oxidase [Planomicrobium sp. CPCC 101110]TWT25273.1 primary-amine oxidase [Planomicrobium sp. CPCC 101110]